MKPASLLAAIGLFTSFILGGCGTTYHVAPERSVARGDTLTLASLDTLLGGQGAIITFRGGHELTATEIKLEKDSCHFRSEDGAHLVYPIESLAKFSKRERLRGAMEGTLYGGLLGWVLGAATTAEMGPEMGLKGGGSDCWRRVGGHGGVALRSHRGGQDRIRDSPRSRDNMAGRVKASS